MCTLTATELKENLGKYIKLGQEEQINVTHRGSLVFTIVPKKDQLKIEWATIFGTLPKEAYDDDSIERE